MNRFHFLLMSTGKTQLPKKNSLMIMALLAMLFMCFAQPAEAKTDTLRVNGTTFVTKTKTVWSEYNRMDTVLQLYRIENGKTKYLLSHFMYQWSADCNNEFTDHGTMQVQNDSLIFETEYTQKTGHDPIPERRKQIYKVMPDGKVKLVFDRELQRDGETWVDMMHTNN